MLSAITLFTGSKQTAAFHTAYVLARTIKAHSVLQLAPLLPVQPPASVSALLQKSHSIAAASPQSRRPACAASCQSAGVCWCRGIVTVRSAVSIASQKH